MRRTRNHDPEAGMSRLATPTSLAVSLLLVAGCGGGKEELSTKGMVYGSAEAIVSASEAPSGEPYSGLGLSKAPEVRPAAPTPTPEVRIDVSHEEIRVADGVTYMAWTFGGSVPGPVIHVRQGDRVRFTLTNRSDKDVAFMPPMPHSVDFHAAMVNPVDKYRSIGPGSTIRFEWVANYPGVFMYHCATPPVLQHLAAGMVGMTIVEPKQGYPTKVDREYALAQSALHLQPAKSGPRGVDLDAAMRKSPTYVAFNGAPNRHVEQPLTAKAGERVRLYVLNVGPSGTSSFHVIGTLFDRVWVDGNPVNELRGLQTVLLGASSGAIVEFVIPEPGIYTFVDHEFADAAMGAVGHINALEGGSIPAGATH